MCMIRRLGWQIGGIIEAVWKGPKILLELHHPDQKLDWVSASSTAPSSKSMRHPTDLVHVLLSLSWIQHVIVKEIHHCSLGRVTTLFTLLRVLQLITLSCFAYFVSLLFSTLVFVLLSLMFSWLPTQKQSHFQKAPTCAKPHLLEPEVKYSIMTCGIRSHTKNHLLWCVNMHEMKVSIRPKCPEMVSSPHGWRG